MIYNIILTHNCNKNCRYCRSQEAEIDFPRNIDYDLKDLFKFIMKDPDPMIAFYGGEPLLGMESMEKIMELIPAVKWIIQTNGHFLHQIKDNYLLRFNTILLSIDGREEITDFYRGNGTYQLVTKNAKLIRDKGFKNELTARMCVSEESDLYKEVNHLKNLKDNQGNELFTGIHWQNNMMFCDFEEYRDFDGWLNSSYYPGIEKLVEEWVNEMETNHFVRLIYPFIGLIGTYLGNTPAKLHCGCGHANFNICTDGTITVCPVSSDFVDIFKVGTIFETNPSDLINKIVPGSPCSECPIYSICGGRCLYANLLKPWGEEGYKRVCNTVFHLWNCLKSKIPRIESLLQKGDIKKSQFNYFKYNGAEIVP